LQLSVHASKLLSEEVRQSPGWKSQAAGKDDEDPHACTTCPQGAPQNNMRGVVRDDQAWDSLQAYSVSRYLSVPDRKPSGRGVWQGNLCSVKITVKGAEPRLVLITGLIEIGL